VRGPAGMRLLFDQNLSHRLVILLTAEYPGSEHVRDVGLNATDDQAIWQYAAQQGLAIISKGFGLPATGIAVRPPAKGGLDPTGNCTTAAVATLLRARQGDLLAFEVDSTASFLVLS
jgi:predicted nuclease of predicted toxin-antitoxin system